MSSYSSYIKNSRFEISSVLRLSAVLLFVCVINYKKYRSVKAIYRKGNLLYVIQIYIYIEDYIIFV